LFYDCKNTNNIKRFKGTMAQRCNGIKKKGERGGGRERVNIKNPLLGGVRGGF
jgi:hypothetical protein